MIEITDEQIDQAATEFSENEVVAGVETSKEDLDFILETGFAAGVRWAMEQFKP